MCTKPALPRLLFLAALIVRSIGEGSSELAETLRRQLMRDNYDYSSEESEESSQLGGHAIRAAHNPSLSPVTPYPNLQPFINEVYVPRATLEASLPPDVNETAAPPSVGDQALRKNELLYYVDEGHLSRRAGTLPTQKENKDDLSQTDEDMLSQEEDETQPSRRVADVPSQVEVLDEETTPKVKYKVKADGASGWRRSGGGGRYHRFLQEERSDGGGVALINLGDGPFPEFRLPQYSRHSHRDPDFEIALPSDIDEPITRPD